MDARRGKSKPMTYRLSLFATTLVFLVVISTGLVPHSTSAQAWGISNLTIEADRSNYLGQCPTTIRLTGKFEANQPFGVVNYQFIHSDGTSSAVSHLTINAKGSFTVEETLRRDAGWNDTIYLRVFLPIPGRTAALPVDSNRIIIKGQCQEVRAAPRQATTSLGPATGRFRGCGLLCRSRRWRRPYLVFPARAVAPVVLGSLAAGDGLLPVPGRTPAHSRFRGHAVG